MCINQKEIIVSRSNGRTQKMLVKCGHCPACLQEKAEKRSNRIKLHQRDGYINLFVTLTYCDECVPYILRDDLKMLQYEHVGDIGSEKYSVPVYRDSVDYSSRRWSSNPTACARVYRKFLRHEVNYKYLSSAKRTYKTVVLPRDCSVSNFYLQHADFSKLKTLKGSKDSRRIGVIYYPDIQNFFKRLRINLSRYYDYSETTIYFSCAEYGPTTCRPHFHLIVECPCKGYSLFKTAIAKSWTFDNNRICQYIEVARNASSYVSSYVNCTSSIPQILAHSDFRPKHSYSPLLGMVKDEFSLSSIIEKIRCGNLTYNRTIYQDGKPTTVVSVIPKYVISRYFPRFKGFNRLTIDERIGLLEEPTRIFTESEISVKLGCTYRPFPLWLSDKLDDSHLSDEYKIFNTINNKLLPYSVVLDDDYDLATTVNRYDYIFAWSRVWELYYSTCYKVSHQMADRLKIPLESFFSNLSDLVSGDLDSCYFNLLDANKVETDPNRFKMNLITHCRYTDKYYKLDKSRKIRNYEMSFHYNV